MRGSLVVLALLALGPGVAGAARPPHAPAAIGTIRSPEADEGLFGAAPFERASRPAGTARAAAVERAAVYPRYFWPLERALGVGLLIKNYVDDDPSSGLLDYMGGVHTYDGHAGTDIHLFDFPLMDHGCIVRAAAPGTVVYMSTPSDYDRNCDFNWPDGGNWVWLAYGDGSYHSYYHLRAHSMTVQMGDQVQAGQMIGLVGSSGYSTGPHLHFETGDDLNGGVYAYRDPWHGTNNPLASLWVSQLPYVGANPLWVVNQGVFIEDQVGGSIFNLDYCTVTARVQQPVVFGADQQKLCMWFQIQGRNGDQVLVEVLRPDGSVYGSFTNTITYDANYDWFWAYFYFNPYVQPSDYGTWKLRTTVSGQIPKETPFVVGATTSFGPRFQGRAGRSFRMDGTVQRDTLRRTPWSGPVTYALLNAPSFVSLTADSIVLVGPASNQPTRSLFFQALMTDGAARHDTAWFHVVDFAKPLEPAVGVAPVVSAATRLDLATPRPDPVIGSAVFDFDLPRAERARLTIHDLAGRRVRVLVDEPLAAGTHRARFDGRDAAGARLPGGVYFARLATGRETRAREFVLLP